MMKLRLLATAGILAAVLLLVGCTAEEAMPDTAAGEAAAVTEPTAEQIESDLGTSQIDEIGSDLDSLILE